MFALTFAYPTGARISGMQRNGSASRVRPTGRADAGRPASAGRYAPFQDHWTWNWQKHERFGMFGPYLSFRPGGIFTL